MYQVHVRTWVDDERQMDSILVKEYARLGNAEREANRQALDTYNHSGQHIVRIGIVFPAMTSVARNEAREAYCKGESVWVNGEHGKLRLRPSWDYCSHASREELFARSIEQSVGWHYEGPYYVAY
jgi:hypothetical protein